jgi:hypothetical protein
MKKILILLLFSFILLVNSQDEKKENLNEESNKNEKEENEKNINEENNENINETTNEEEIDDFVEIFPETEIILELNDDNMRDTVLNNTYVLVFFYNRFYEKCSDFIPKYINVAKKFKENNPEIIFGRLNGEKNFETVIFNSINDYPSIILFINNTNHFFKNVFEEYNLEIFLEKKIFNPILERNNYNDIREENKNQTIYFISSIDPEKEKEKYENLREIAKKYDDIFEIYNCYQCKEDLKSELNLIKISPDGEKTIKYDNNTFNFDSLDYFIRKYHRNYKEGLNYEDLYFVFRFNLSIIIYFREDEKEEDVKKDEIFSNLHLQYEGKYIITHSDILNSQVGKEIGNFFILEQSDLPIVKIYDQSEMHSYSYNGEITKEKIIDLINKYEKNELIREKNSEQIPSEEEDQNMSLHYLVGKTFNKEIYNGSLNYIVLFSKSNNEEENEKLNYLFNNLTYLAEKYQLLKEKRIKFGIINLEYNDIDNVIEETPSVGLFIDGKKDKPIFYKGDIQSEKIEKWIFDSLGYEIPTESIDDDVVEHDKKDNNKDKDDNEKNDL